MCLVEEGFGCLLLFSPTQGNRGCISTATAQDQVNDVESLSLDDPVAAF